MTGPKLDEPERRPEMGAQGSDSGEASFFEADRCREADVRGADPDRVGNSDIGWAPTHCDETPNHRITSSLECRFLGEFLVGRTSGRQWKISISSTSYKCLPPQAPIPEWESDRHTWRTRGLREGSHPAPPGWGPSEDICQLPPNKSKREATKQQTRNGFDSIYHVRPESLATRCGTSRRATSPGVSGCGS